MDDLTNWIKKNPLIIVAIVLFFVWNSNKTKTEITPEPTPAVVSGQSFDEDESWETLARWVESQPVEDTDHLLKIATVMRDTGVVSRESMKRLDSLLSQNKAITEQNKADIAKLVRGR